MGNLRPLNNNVQFFEDENSYKFVYTQYEQKKSSFDITISWVSILIVLAIIFVCIYFFTGEKNKFIKNFEESGFVFADSDVRILTEEDIEELQSNQNQEYDINKLLRMAINELYARHNYRFSKEEYLNFYCKYNWYYGTSTAQQAFAEFNLTERENLNFLCEAERNLSFE